MSRTSFFSEDNLFIILGILEDMPQLQFNASDSDSKAMVFEVMSNEYNEKISLSDLNKNIIRKLYTSLNADPSRANTNTTFPRTTNNNDPPNRKELSSNLNRDLEINSRSAPSMLPDRPLHQDHHADLSSAFEKLQQSRHPTDTHIPDEINFLDKNETSDTTHTLNRFEELQHVRNQDISLSNEKILKEEVEETELISTSNVITAQNEFDTKFSEREAVIGDHAKKREEVFVIENQAFKKAQVFDPNQNQDEQRPVSPRQHSMLLPNTSPTGLFVEDDRMATDIQLLQKPLDHHQSDFERDLMKHHMNEKESLIMNIEKPHINYNADLLHTNKRTYETDILFVEMSSTDRNRSIATNESPAIFNVYFASQKTATYRYPIFHNHPFELTTDVRRQAGLRGCPNHANIISNPSLCHIIDYEEIEFKNKSGGANIDSVLRNITNLRLNHIQLHVNISNRIAIYPYILLEIVDYDNMYTSTTTNVRKSFCKLFYDRTNCPGEHSKHHLFIPMANEEKIFCTPIASIDLFSFRLLTPKGKPILDNIEYPDSLLIKRISILPESVTNAPNAYYVAIDLHHYINVECFNENDIISISDVEWYNQNNFINWASSSEVDDKLTLQYTLENEYEEAINPTCNDNTKTSSELIKLRDEFATNQIKFHYPTRVGETNTLFHKWLCENCHVVTRMESVDSCDEFGNVIQASSSALYGNRIIIPYVYDINITNGVQYPRLFGYSNITDFINNYVILELNQTDLLYGVIRNESMQTNISMNIGYRKESTENTESLQPHNI